MNLSRPDRLTRLDALAAEYALGTLPGRARRRLARVAQTDTVVASAIRGWEHRLSPLADAAPPITPSPRVWRVIALRLGLEPVRTPTPGPWWTRVGFWRGFAACELRRGGRACARDGDAAARADRAADRRRSRGPGREARADRHDGAGRPRDDGEDRRRRAGSTGPVARTLDAARRRGAQVARRAAAGRPREDHAAGAARPGAGRRARACRQPGAGGRLDQRRAAGTRCCTPDASNASTDAVAVACGSATGSRRGPDARCRTAQVAAGACAARPDRRSPRRVRPRLPHARQERAGRLAAPGPCSGSRVGQVRWRPSAGPSCAARTTAFARTTTTSIRAGGWRLRRRACDALHFLRDTRLPNRRLRGGERGRRHDRQSQRRHGREGGGKAEGGAQQASGSWRGGIASSCGSWRPRSYRISKASGPAASLRSGAESRAGLRARGARTVPGNRRF